MNALSRPPSSAALLFAAAAAAANAAAASPASAQQNAASEEFVPAPVVLDTMTIEAVRFTTAEGALPGSVQVVDGDEVVRVSGGDLKRFLAQRVAGLQPSNGTISGASETLRGRRIQVLINGVPRVSELRGFSRELSLIDVDSIARVEIVKGATAVYGNGATGGLINIVTKTADEEGFHFGSSSRFSVQDEDLDDSAAVDVSGFGSFRKGDFGARVDLGGVFSDDTFDGAGRLMPSDPLVGQGGGDNLDSYNLAASVEYKIDDHELLLRGTAVNLEQDLRYNPDYTTDPVSTNKSSPYAGRDVDDETYSISGDYRNRELIIGDLQITGFYSHSDRRAAFVPLGPANPLVYYSGDPLNPQDPDNQSKLETEQYGVRGSLANDVGVGVLTVGVDWQHDDVKQKILDGRNIIAPMEQDSVAGFAQIDIPINQHFDLRGGFRYEKFFLDVSNFTRPEAYQLGVPRPLPALDVEGGDFDYDAWVFNIGGVVHVNAQLDVFAGFSQGYSIPDVGAFTRRAINRNPFDPTPLSFSSLKPRASKVNNYEVGARYNNAFLSAEGTLFVSTSDDGTTFDPATNAVSQQKERIWGAELNLEAYPTEDLTLGTVVAYQEGKFDSNDDGSIDSFLPNNRIATPFTATLYADYNITPEFSVGGDLAYSAERTRDPAFKIQDTFQINLRARYALLGGELNAGVTNLLDAAEQNPTASSVRNIPIAAEGRRLWIGYKLAF